MSNIWSEANGAVSARVNANIRIMTLRQQHTAISSILFII